MRYDILVGGTDVQYIRALVGFLVESKNNQFNLSFIDTSEQLLGFLADDNFDLYLIEEILLLSVSHALTPELKKKLQVLTEALTTIDTMNMVPVLKYQNIYNIEKSLLHKLESSTTEEVVTTSGRRTPIVSFYSCMGGVGTSTLAQIFAQGKSAKGHKVLFISLEDMPGCASYFHSNTTTNLSDYMVYMLTNRNWLRGLETMVSVDTSTGVYYMKPVVHAKDLFEFEESLWQQWIAYIAERGDYEYLVLDLGRQLYKSSMALLSMSNHRVYITANDPVATNKWQGFIAQCEQSGVEGLFLDKTVVCYERLDQPFPVAGTYDLRMPKDKELYKVDREGHCHLNPHSAVFRLVEESLGHV